MKITHYKDSYKPLFIDVYMFSSLNVINLHYLKEDWDKSRKYLVGTWNIKYKTND